MFFFFILKHNAKRTFDLIEYPSSVNVRNIYPFLDNICRVEGKWYFVIDFEKKGEKK